MKKIVNNPESVVLEMCNGIVAAYPQMELDRKYKVIRKRKINENKVTLLSGGGSGHEPAHAGFIGTGMLDGAVCGDVFASPSQIQVYKGIKQTASNKGTLLIIKNYSGDMMNFKNAAYMAKEDGLTVDYVKVDDDIAVEDSLYTVGRRGVAGTVFVHKIAGAAAEAGATLLEVKRLAQKTIENVKSIGFALTSCTVPAKGTPTFEIGGQEMEYGVGIHGEPGTSREAVVSADELAGRMADSLLTELRIEPGQEAEAAILVNGFGGTPLQELYLFNNAVLKVLTERGVRASRIYVGNYMTSIDMAGASLSILKLDEELKQYLSMYCDAPAFMARGTEADCCFQPLETAAEKAEAVPFSTAGQEFCEIAGNKISLSNIIYLINKMGDVIIENEVPFCELDAHAGDGDFGMSVAKGFRKLKEEWHELVSSQSDTIGRLLEECAMVIMEYCGGASGPIWGSAFRSAGKAAEDMTEVDAVQFAAMLQAAVKGIQDIGERSFGRGAVVGDKTLIDALVPCADVWSVEAGQGTEVAEIFSKAASAAVEGAKKTEEIVARMGRAGTVGERSIGYPDAGAHALGVIFTELSKAVR